MNTAFLTIVLYMIGAAVLFLVIFFLFRREKTSLKSLKLKLLLVKVYVDAGNEENKSSRQQREREIANDINISEQLIASLLSMNEPFVFEVAVPHLSGEIHFYIAVPENRVEFASRQIQGLYPDSSVEAVPDYNIFTQNGGFAGGYFTLKESPILPIRTYDESQVDTFSQILSNMSKLAEVGEGAAIQLVIRPIKKKTVKKNADTAIESLRKGEKMRHVLKRTKLVTAHGLKVLVGLKKDASDDGGNKFQVDDDAIKALQAKIAKPAMSVNMRIFAAGEDQSRAEDILMSIAGAYGQFSATNRNEFIFIKPRRLKKLLYRYSFRMFEERTALTLNAQEVASVFHLPSVATDVPRLKLLKTKESEPPENLPDEGLTIGESFFRGDRVPVRMQAEDRRRHLYIIGQTGTGKSYGMLSMVEQDMKNGEGICVIDPHGELVSDILERVPENRAQDVIVFDPGDISRPLGLNMLEFDPERPEQKTFIVNEMQAIFDKLFSKETMGPMFEQYMRNALLLLMEDAHNEPATLMEVPRIFIDAEFRKRKLARITNPTVIDFWEKEAAKATGETSLANMAPYITTKFGNFISNDYIRPIIGQVKSAFDFREVMDTKKILLVNLSKGRIGDINAGLIGMVITGRILMAALARADMEKEDREDFYFYIDEFQNFTTDSISVILSEARKYKLNLILAHQFIDQLEDEIRDAVFGNVGSMLAFRVGVPDTEKLEKHFAPQFTSKDLISIDNQNAFVKLLIDGEPTTPFNMKTVRVNPGSKELREKIKELSRLTYGRDKNEVERDILKRLRI